MHGETLKFVKTGSYTKKVMFI